MVSKLERVVIPVTPFQQNCSVLWCSATQRGAVVDPGGDLDRIAACVQDAGITLDKVLLTHAHLDHAAGARVFADAFKIPIEGPQAQDEFWLASLPQQAQRYGFPAAPSFTPDRWLVDGDTVSFGAQTMQVLHCPGHTPGPVVFYHASGVAFVGDVLFQGSIGRTDFPRGDHSQLIDSIRSKLWPLGDAVTFVPGHGPESTFGFERRTNPFVADALFD